MTSLALPRVRSRRRKRRPMTWLERLAAVMVLWCSVFTGYDLYYAFTQPSLGSALFSLANAIFQCVMGRFFYWPKLRDYIKNGWIDE
jgi:hypothetical protein